MSEPVFSTERFDVFHVHCERNPELGVGRDVYLAFHRVDNIPRPLCTVTLFGNYVEWLEVEAGERRKGIATEVMRALELHVGELQVDGVTEEGVAFEAAYCEHEQPPNPSLCGDGGNDGSRKD